MIFSRNKSIYILLAGIVFAIVCGLFLYYFFVYNGSREIVSKNSIPKSFMKKEESSIDHFSATQYYQTFSFDYPKTYVISEGGRPFNVNDEGTMYTVNAYCTDAENCRTNNQYCINKTDCIDEKQNTFMVSVYENRQDWNLDEWIRQSVYAPYHECNEKDPKATLQKQTYRNYEAYKFSYASNQNQSHGCINVEGTQKGNGEELFFLNNKVVYSLSTFSNVQKLKLELDRMIETFAIVQN